MVLLADRPNAFVLPRQARDDRWLDRFQWKCAAGKFDPLRPQMRLAQEDGCSIKQAPGHVCHFPVARVVEKSSFRPLIESAHGWAAPNLIIDFARRLAGIGPAR